MPSLDLSNLKESERPTGVWAASLLHAIARDEAAGRRTPRLTEPKLGTWARFRGRLTSSDLVALLFEDAAVIHPVPFSPSELDAPLDPNRLPTAVTDAWLEAIATLPLDLPGPDYINDQARLLGLPSRLARSDLHIVKPHQKVLELPGTGGQLAHHLVSSQRDLSLQANFVVACASWQERTLAGIVGLDLAAPQSDFAVRADAADFKNPDHPVRQRTFDFVIGLHPDKGGLFQVAEQLAIWFPTAKHLLV